MFLQILKIENDDYYYNDYNKIKLIFMISVTRLHKKQQILLFFSLSNFNFVTKLQFELRIQSRIKSIFIRTHTYIYIYNIFINYYFFEQLDYKKIF